MKTLKDLKAGDTCWVDERRGGSQKKITSVGPKYITIGKNKYSRETGQATNTYGYICTVEKRLAAVERNALFNQIRDLGLVASPYYNNFITSKKLAKILAILQEPDAT